MEKIENAKPLPKPEKIKRFGGFNEIPSDPKAEGLRPGKRYAGGDPDEIIIVDGKKFRKEIAIKARIRNFGGQIISERPYTEKEYYSHSTDGVGPGPGWDYASHYLMEGWKITRKDPERLSDLPLYNLEPIEG